MKTCLTTLSVLALGSVLSAQTSTVTAATNLGAYARANKSIGYKFAKRGTKVTSALRVVATAGRDLSARASAVTAVYKRPVTTRGGAAVTLSDSGSVVMRSRGEGGAGTSASGDPSNVRPGPHSILLHVEAKQGTKYKVAMVIAGKISAKDIKAAGAVDIGADGKVDFSAAADNQVHRKTIEAVAGAKGLLVKLTTEARLVLAGTGNAGYGLSVTVTATPAGGGQRCTFTSYGRSCGPVLTGSAQLSSNAVALDFLTKNAEPNSVALFLLGKQRQSTTIPGTRCLLSVQGLYFFARMTDAKGNAKLALRLGRFATDFVCQDLVISLQNNKLEIATTNGLAVSCKTGS